MPKLSFLNIGPGRVRDWKGKELVIFGTQYNIIIDIIK